MDNELLMQIMMLDFGVQDASLFLDTHPGDKEAMRYIEEAQYRLHQAKKEYAKAGHALNNRVVGAYEMDYISSAWPWEGDKQCGYMKNDCNIL